MMNRTFVVIALLVGLAGYSVQAQIRPPRKISSVDDIRTDQLQDLDAFGSAVARIGDLDGNGIDDLAVGMPLSDDGGIEVNSDRGGVWVLFLQSDGSVAKEQKISVGHGGFTGHFEDGDLFGSSVTALGDLNGDGTPELVVGAPGDDSGGRDSGAIWLLFLREDGTVREHRKISHGVGGFDGSDGEDDGFGASVSNVGDLDNDGVNDIAVGAPGGGSNARRSGAIWILFLSPDGTVKTHRKIDDAAVDLVGGLDEDDRFGSSTAPVGDLDGDGVTELAVGSPRDDDGDESAAGNRGAVWVLFLRPDGTEKGAQKISASEGAFTGLLEDNDRFGSSVEGIGDLDDDGVADLAVGSFLDDDGGSTLAANRGAVWIVFLRADGTVKAHQKVSAVAGDFSGTLHDGDRFGSAIGSLGDLDGDGVTELAVGAPGDDDGGSSLNADRGAVWILFLRSDGTVRPPRKLSSTQGNLTSTLDDDDRFGQSLATLGDLDGDARIDVAVGAPNDDDGGRDEGAVWLLFLHGEGDVKTYRKISAIEGRFNGELDVDDHFGTAIATLGDLDGDGVTDIAVGAPFDDDGGIDRGAVWILFLLPDGRVKGHRKISQISGKFEGSLSDDDHFGSAVASIGDLDGDGITELAVGAPNDGDGGRNRGAVWILFLASDASVLSERKISSSSSGFGVELTDNSLFGSSVSTAGDFNDDGVPDIVVGAPGGQGPTSTLGAVWMLFLREDGSVLPNAKAVYSDEPPSGAPESDGFGASVSNAGDLDGDGAGDFLVGAVREGGVRGAVYVLFMNPDGTTRASQVHSRTSGDFAGTLPQDSGFGSALGVLGDLNNDGVQDLIVGASQADDGGINRGAVWISFNALLPPPLIQDLQVSPEAPEPGDGVRISARVAEAERLSEVSISFRAGGDAQFLSAPMSPSGSDRFAFTIPGFVTGSRGIEYFVSARNVNGLQSKVPAQGLLSVSVSIPDGLTKALEAGNESEAYRLLTVPLNLEETSARSIFEGALGPYDRKEWRFFGYSQDGLRHELNEDDILLSPGVAFWLLVREANRSFNSGSGSTVRTASPFTIRLNKGWNYIGNPFNFPIPLANVQSVSGQPVDLRDFKGYWSEVGATLIPFVGLAAYSDLSTTDTLEINPDLSAGDVHASFQTSGKSEGIDVWAIRILARKGSARDRDNLAAARDGASAGWDLMDRPEPPPIGDYVSVYFPHSEWNGHSLRYSTDARPPPEDGAEWPIEVTSARDGVVHLSFQIDDVPDRFEVMVVDDALQTSQDLRIVNEYTVASPGPHSARRLRLLVGTAAWVGNSMAVKQGSPEALMLFQNFPNPFRGVTTIRYALDRRGEVQLQVFNVLGDRVATLIDRAEQVPGFHSLVWDGANAAGFDLPSGAYYLRLRVGDQTRTTAIMRVR